MGQGLGEAGTRTVLVLCPEIPVRLLQSRGTERQLLLSHDPSMGQGDGRSFQGVAGGEEGASQKNKGLVLREALCG